MLFICSFKWRHYCSSLEKKIFDYLEINGLLLSAKKNRTSKKGGPFKMLVFNGVHREELQSLHCCTSFVARQHRLFNFGGCTPIMYDFCCTLLELF